MDKETKFTLAVKNNLRSFLKTANFNITAEGSFIVNDEASSRKYLPLPRLREALEKKWLSEEDVIPPSKPDAKIQKILSDNQAHIDPYFINEICELYGFPIDRVMTCKTVSPKEAEEIMSEIKNAPVKRFAPLSKAVSKAYFGKFYGYSFDHNPNEKKSLLEFELCIFEDENNNPKAEYSFTLKSGDKTVFSGVPYYFSELKSVSIEMTAENNRRFQYLYFNGKPYNSSMLYKVGVCVRTSSASAKNEPDVKSFVITSFKLPEDKVSEIIPALLKMSNNNFYITASKLKKLREDLQIDKFCNENQGSISLIDGEVYSINEIKILSSIEYDEEDERIKAFECLAKIKSDSLAPDRVTYLNSEAIFNFFRKLKAETEQNGS